MSRKNKDRKKQQQQAAKQTQQQATPEPVKKCDAFEWDLTKERAAHLLAEDHITKTEIAATLGVAVMTLWRWEQSPEFAARVAEHQKHLANYSRRYMIARRGYRLGNLQRRLLAMEQVIAERAADPAMKRASGGETGLLVRKIKMIGSGPLLKEVEEFEVDTGLLKEMRDTEKQAAQEAGQWVNKVAPTSPDGSDEYSGMLAPDRDEFRKLPIAERIRILGSPVRSYLRSREESSAAGSEGTVSGEH